VPESSISNDYLRHVCYLFHKLFRKTPREKWLLTYYALFILLYPFVQELSAKTSSKDQKEQKWAKATSPWRAEILQGEIFRQARQTASSSKELEKQDKSTSPLRAEILPD